MMSLPWATALRLSQSPSALNSHVWPSEWVHGVPGVEFMPWTQVGGACVAGGRDQPNPSWSSGGPRAFRLASAEAPPAAPRAETASGPRTVFLARQRQHLSPGSPPNGRTRSPPRALGRLPGGGGYLLCNGIAGFMGPRDRPQRSIRASAFLTFPCPPRSPREPSSPRTPVSGCSSRKG